MKKDSENENIFPFTMDLKDDDGNLWTTISVLPSKNSSKRDILFMDAHKRNYSVRCITELLNIFGKT